MQLTLVMPVYNEADCIQSVLEDWILTLSTVVGKHDFQIIALDDGSKDDSLSKLIELQKKYNQLKIIKKQNEGHGKTILKGYQLATESGSKFTFQTDSDNQFLPTDFNQFWKYRHLYDFQLGYREHRNDPLSRIIISKMMKTLVQIFHRVSIPDANCPYRLFKTDELKKRLTKIPTDTFAPNILLSILFAKQKRPNYLPVKHLDRTTGQTVLISKNLRNACLLSFKQIIKFKSK